MTKLQMRMRFFEKFAELALFAREKKIDFIVTSFHRTADQQNVLFQRGVSKLDGYNKKSYHQKWRAIDVCIILDGKYHWSDHENYIILGEKWKEMGGVWGGSWDNLHDIYHFQY